MTKRHLKNELDALSDDLLGELTAAERLQLAFTATASGRDGWMADLHETCPRACYEQPELAFTARKRLAFTLAQQAVYDLRTTTLLFGWTETNYRIRSVLTFCSELDPSEYGFEFVPRDTRARRFRGLCVYYEGYACFADETLGVDLEEWLALHPDGLATVAMAETVLEEEADLRTLAEAEYADGTDDEVSLDGLAAQFAESLQKKWDETVAEFE